MISVHTVFMTKTKGVLKYIDYLIYISTHDYAKHVCSFIQKY